MSVIVPKGNVKQFIINVMTKLGVTKTHAECLADVLVTGDYRGHYSHGINRLYLYMKDIQANTCAKSGEPEILKQSAATAWVDGKNLLGPVVGKFCMNLAIQKAKQCGIGWVVAKGSNHFGIAGYYSMMALEHKLMGMSFTNASPLMSVTRGKEPFFGTNPISLSAPGKSGDDFVLDMATSVVALGKVEIASRKEESIPVGWAVDKDGKSVTDPSKYYALMPLGGAEEFSGYKGYGLAAMVEIFTSILSGATVAPNVRNWSVNDQVANLGHCFIAINPEFFAPGYEDRIGGLISDLRNQEPADPKREVLVHGDPERAHMAQCDKQGGIDYHPNQIKMANDFSKELNIEQLKTL